MGHQSSDATWREAEGRETISAATLPLIQAGEPDEFADHQLLISGSGVRVPGGVPAF